MILKTIRNGIISLVVMLAATFVVWKVIITVWSADVNGAPVLVNFLIGTVIGLGCGRIGVVVFRKLEQRTNYYK